MKTLYSILFLFSFSTHLCAQSLIIDSTRFITGVNCCTSIQFAIPTADKGILLVGTDDNNPGGIIPYFPIDTSGNGNVLIVKIDSNHQISWLKVYGGSQLDEGMSACQTPDGGYAVLATTMSNDGDVTGLLGGEDMWLVRTDNAGNLFWQKNFGCTTAGGTLAMSVANTPDGGFILLGACNGYGGDVPFHYGSAFESDWVVVKTDSVGNLQWCKDLGGTDDENDIGSIISADGGYYLISSTSSTDHDCTDTTWHPGVYTGNDYYILKLNDTGAVLWDSSYGGGSDDDVYYAMYDARDSTIMITGSTASDDYMVTGYHGGGDMWVLKVNINGTLIWEKALGTPNVETGTSICAAPDNGYLAYGFATGNIGGRDAWIVNLDNNGNELTNLIFGGAGREEPYSIVPDLNGYVATGISGSLVFTEGTTYGNFDISSLNPDGGGAFVSYIDYWPLAVNNVNAEKSMLIIFPNPTQNSVQVLLGSNTNGGSLTILNYTGQLIYANAIKSFTTEINITTQEWTKGIYLVQWQGDNGQVLTGKLVID